MGGNVTDFKRKKLLTTFVCKIWLKRLTRFIYLYGKTKKRLTSKVNVIEHKVISGIQSKFPSSTITYDSTMGSFVLLIYIFLPYTSQIFREPLDYIKDVFNYLDLSGYILILATYVLRLYGSDAQWMCASFAIVINYIGIFKYSAVDR